MLILVGDRKSMLDWVEFFGKSGEACMVVRHLLFPGTVQLQRKCIESLHIISRIALGLSLLRKKFAYHQGVLTLLKSLGPLCASATAAQCCTRPQDAPHLHLFPKL